ncbi:MAG: polysaccharide biosynthesis tyrosine autokinase [Acidimicrobiia bacterium]
MLNAEQLLAVLWKRRVTFLATFAVVVGAVAAVTFSLPNVYSTSSYLWVNSTRGTATDFEATQMNQILTKTYAELLQTRTMAVAVASKLPYSASPGLVESSVAVSPISQSQLIQIRAESSSPRQAQQLADTYAEVFIDRVGPLNESTGVEGRVSLAERASLPQEPIRPRPGLYLLVGTLLAAFLATVAATLRHRLDRRIDIESSTTHILGLPIIARIPELASAGSGGSADGGENRMEYFSDAFRLLYTNLTFADGTDSPRSIAVVSANPSEGKSTVCMRLGQTAAELNLRVALVDADLRRPRLSSMRDTQSGKGLSTLLEKFQPLSLTDVAIPFDGTAMKIIPSGPLPPNPTGLLRRQRLTELTTRAKNLFDLVIFDTPPISVGADASLVATTTDMVILVIDSRSTRHSDVVQAIEQLQRAKANVLGVVLNRLEPNAGAYYRYYYTARRPGGRLRRGRQEPNAPAPGPTPAGKGE